MAFPAGVIGRSSNGTTPPMQGIAFQGELDFLDHESTGDVQRNTSDSSLGQATARLSQRISDRDLPMRVTSQDWNDMLERHSLNSDRKEHNKMPFVDRSSFDSFMGLIIFANALTIGLEVDMRQDDSDALVWVIIDNVFCLLWLFEMFSKLYYWRLKYFHNPWNHLDVFLVILSIFDAWVLPIIGSAPGGSMRSLSLLKIFRIVRMLRLLRLLRIMKLFKNLWLIVNGFMESVSTLSWVIILMSIVIYVFAVFVRITITCGDGAAYAEWYDCETYFGTLPGTMFSLFQVLTLDSWSMTIGRPVIEVQPAMFIVFLFFLFLTTFGLLNIVVGVIVENTLNAAKENKALQERRNEHRIRKELTALRVVFEQADSNGDGRLDRYEFLEAMENQEIKRVLARMDVPLNDPDQFFEMLDVKENEALSFTEFVEGITRVRGPASGAELRSMLLAVRSISKRLEGIQIGLAANSPFHDRSFSQRTLGPFGSHASSPAASLPKTAVEFFSDCQTNGNTSTCFNGDLQCSSIASTSPIADHGQGNDMIPRERSHPKIEAPANVEAHHCVGLEATISTVKIELKKVRDINLSMLQAYALQYEREITRLLDSMLEMQIEMQSIPFTNLEKAAVEINGQSSPPLRCYQHIQNGSSCPRPAESAVPPEASGSTHSESDICSDYKHCVEGLESRIVT